ncbi:MAG: aminotransferase class I/II-fold pyridoxal phosphate-dependent enzyme [Bacteroidota bacterium]
MGNQYTFLDTVDGVITEGVKKGVLHLYTGTETFKENKLQINGCEVINFGSCSYLGLEFDERLRSGAVDAVIRYGTQFSSSRAYISTGQYAELEHLFEQIFGHPVVIAPTTSLAHIAVIPVVVGNDDAVIIDHQVHNSVQTAVNLLKPRGITVEMMRHNRMDLLEEKINELKATHRKVWYMADGIYSMYGDAAPLDELQQLLHRYDGFHLYLDDAHGMSCFGKHGRGYVLSKIDMHPRMIVATSLAKAFATGGSVVVFPDNDMARKVRTCGGPLITSGPIQPATLGAAIASAKIHLTDEIIQLQEDLQQNILYTNLQIKKYGLPLVAQSPSPVFFIGVSLPKIAWRILQFMMEKGFYLNIGTFPAVPMKNSGIRFTITRLHTFSQIENMIENLSFALQMALEEENFTIEGIAKAFRSQLAAGSWQSADGSSQLAVGSPQPAVFSQQMPGLDQQNVQQEIIPDIKHDPDGYRCSKNSSELRLLHFHSVTEMGRDEWDAIFGDSGSFDYNGLRILEDTFKNGKLPENKWEFDYLLVKKGSRTVAATFLTTTLMKDDMLAPAEISEQVEEIRSLSGPYYKTSRVLMMGSMLTEGEHLFIDKTENGWPGVKNLLLEKINELQYNNEAQVVILRDIDFNDEQTEEIMLANGYFKTKMPDKFVVNNLIGENMENYISKQSYKTRRHIRSEILKYSNEFKTEFIIRPDEKTKKLFYRLYKNVKTKNLELNTFNLPESFFENVYENREWEVMVIKENNAGGKIITVVFIHVGKETYNPMVIGIDYDHGCAGSPYREALFRFVERAVHLGKKTVNLGFSAPVEKKKVGGIPMEYAAYIYANDNYIFESLASYSLSKQHIPVKR